MQHHHSIRFSAVLLFLVLAGNSFAQIKTEGTRTEKDSATGATKTITYTEVKEEEVITPRHNMITVNPLKFILFWNLTYYHSFNSVVAGGIGFQMPTLSHTGGYGFNAEVRFYPSRKALRGFYIAPNVSFNHLTDDYFYNIDGSTSTLSTDVFSVGVLVGWQWYIGDDFAIGLGIGADHYFSSNNGSDYYSLFSSYIGTVPSLRFDIGYGW